MLLDLYGLWLMALGSYILLLTVHYIQCTFVASHLLLTATCPSQGNSLNLHISSKVAYMCRAIDRWIYIVYVHV